MPSREYQIEADEILPDDFVPGDPISAPADDPGALAELMLKAASVLEMVGGVFTVAAMRKEIAPGLWVPDRYVAKWDSFAPGGSMRRQREKAQPQSETQPEVAQQPAEPTEPAPELDLAAEEQVEPLAEPELTQAEVDLEAEMAAEELEGDHPTPDPDVDPAPPGSSGFDVGSLLGGGDAGDSVLAGIEG